MNCWQDNTEMEMSRLWNPNGPNKINRVTKTHPDYTVESQWQKECYPFGALDNIDIRKKLHA